VDLCRYGGGTQREEGGSLSLRHDRSEPHFSDETVRADRTLTHRDLQRARTALHAVEDQLRGLFPQVTGEATSRGPQVLTPEMNEFVLLSAERGRLWQTTRTR
jgi:hypothetical protein